MLVMKEEGSRPIKAWVGMKDIQENDLLTSGLTMIPDIEGAALQQLKNLAKLPFIAPNGVAVMPDVHAGIGSTVGTVIATDKVVIPAAVGVDIGCGMNAVRLSLKAHQLPDNLKPIRDAIEVAAPSSSGGCRNWNWRAGATMPANKARAIYLDGVPQAA